MTNLSYKKEYSKKGITTGQNAGDLDPDLYNKNKNIKDAIREIRHLYSLRYMSWKITGITDHENIYRKHHVSICGKYPITDTNPQIWGNETKDKSYIKNVHHCNSVWACPICRFKIMATRTAEIINISKGEQKQNKYMSFLTLTRQHRRHKNIKELENDIKQFNQDFRYITGLTALRKYKDSANFAYIKAFEIMYNSKNGYHPHFHIILYANSREDLQQIAEIIIKAWLKLSPRTTEINQKHIQVYDKPDERLEQYISKMNMALEITNLYSQKNSNRKSINPLNALNLLIEKDYSIFSETELKKIYNEYIHVTKGIRSITYSKGLKVKHNISEKTDQEICEDTTELKTEIATISKTLYRRLVKINSIHQLIIAGDNYLNNENSTILIELRRILTDKLLIPIEWRNNIIVPTDEAEETNENTLINNPYIRKKRDKEKEKQNFNELKDKFNKFNIDIEIKKTLKTVSK